MAFRVPTEDLTLIAHSYPNMPHPIEVRTDTTHDEVRVEFGDNGAGRPLRWVSFDSVLFSQPQRIWEPIVRHEIERFSRRLESA